MEYVIIGLIANGIFNVCAAAIIATSLDRMIPRNVNQHQSGVTRHVYMTLAEYDAWQAKEDAGSGD